MSNPVPKQTIHLSKSFCHTSGFLFEAYARLRRWCRTLKNPSKILIIFFKESQHIVLMKVAVMNDRLIIKSHRVALLLNILFSSRHPDYFTNYWIL